MTFRQLECRARDRQGRPLVCQVCATRRRSLNPSRPRLAAGVGGIVACLQSGLALDRQGQCQLRYSRRQEIEAQSISTNARCSAFRVRPLICLPLYKLINGSHSFRLVERSAFAAGGSQASSRRTCLIRLSRCLLCQMDARPGRDEPDRTSDRNVRACR